MIEQGFIIKEKPIIDIEKEILYWYWSALRFNIEFQNLLKIVYYDNIGIDICAKQQLPNGYVLVNTNRCRMYIVDKYILNKYAAYIWHDNYIYNSLGMLLNNFDNNNSINCEFKNGFIITKRIIEPEESLRIDYGYNINKYPPIPQEIINIRKEFLKL